MNPKTEVEWGAHAPRVRFSAPSRKTSATDFLPVVEKGGHWAKNWTRGVSSHTRGGCAPHLRSSG